ncbi:MAG: hypothetical protein AAGC71_00170 [Pseudomonadota bacterium]
MDGYKVFRAVVIVCLTAVAVDAQAQAPEVIDERRADFKRKTETTKVDQTMEQTFDIDLPMEPLIEPCSGQVELEYDQFDTLARVSAKLTGTACDIASASYKLVINTRDADYNVSSTTHALAWDPLSNSAFPGSGDYSIGADIDLVNVRARQFKCRCRKTDAPTADDQRD